MELVIIESFAQRHHGLVTFDAARRQGASKSSWYRALDRGVLEPVHPLVARVVGSARSREQRILAAVLALRQGRVPPGLVVASHRSAAYLLGLERPDDDPVDVIVTSGHARSLDGVVVHRPIVRADLRPTTRQGVPCTNELRTLVDLGAVDARAVPAALDRFVGTRRITPRTMAALLERHRRRGHSGVAALRRALGAWPLADAIPDSELELAMARLLRSHGLPPARFHARIEGFEVDFHIVGSPVIVECDGWTYHVADRRAWERDLDRDAALHAAGFVVLRRSRGQVLYEPVATAERVRALLTRWAPHLLAS